LRLAKLQESSQLCNIEADNDIAIDHRHWRCHVAEFFKFIEGSLVGSNISVREIDLVWKETLSPCRKTFTQAG
jgi:hypothetical protein